MEALDGRLRDALASVAREKELRAELGPRKAELEEAREALTRQVAKAKAASDDLATADSGGLLGFFFRLVGTGEERRKEAKEAFEEAETEARKALDLFGQIEREVAPLQADLDHLGNTAVALRALRDEKAEAIIKAGGPDGEEVAALRDDLARAREEEDHLESAQKTALEASVSAADGRRTLDVAIEKALAKVSVKHGATRKIDLAEIGWARAAAGRTRDKLFALRDTVALEFFGDLLLGNFAELSAFVDTTVETRAVGLTVVSALEGYAPALKAIEEQIQKALPILRTRVAQAGTERADLESRWREIIDGPV